MIFKKYNLNLFRISIFIGKLFLKLPKFIHHFPLYLTFFGLKNIYYKNSKYLICIMIIK